MNGNEQRTPKFLEKCQKLGTGRWFWGQCMDRHGATPGNLQDPNTRRTDSKKYKRGTEGVESDKSGSERDIREAHGGGRGAKEARNGTTAESSLHN